MEVESLLKQIWHSYHTEMDIRALAMMRTTTAHIPTLNISNIPRVSPLHPNRKLIRQCFVHDYLNKEKLYNARMSSFTGSWLCSDHTFKVAGNVGMWQKGQWIRQFDSMFSIMNEEGIILAWQLTRGTGFSRVKSLLMGLQKRFNKRRVIIRGFSIDNCCFWRLLLQGVFGLIPIKLDLFRAVQRIASKIKKRHPLRRNCLNSFRLVFRQSGDIEKERKQPTPSRQVMLVNLARFRENWTNVELSGDKVLSDKAHKELDKLKVHIEKGCLENIPPKAGTSRQESIHKSLRKSVEKRRVGVKVAVASIGTCLYRWNERRLSDKTGSSTVPPVTYYLDSIDIHEDQEVFGTGELQTKCIEEELEDSPEPGPFYESDSNSSSSEDERN